MTATQITIESNNKRKVRTRVDGDQSEDLPIKMTMVQRGLSILVPPTD